LTTPSGHTRGERQHKRQRQRLGAYGIARDIEGRILLVRAATYLTVAGRWFLPGGGVEHGETPADALRREVTEETGLDIGAVTLLGVLSDTWPIPDGTILHSVRLVYRLEDWSGTLRDEASGSSDRAAWFSPSELDSVQLVRYVREALARFTDLSIHPTRG
jgi:8-oxo-dGTP diphosphatase